MLPEKLRNRSAHELWVRGRQRLTIAAERLGLRWRGLGSRPTLSEPDDGVPTSPGDFLRGAPTLVRARWPDHVTETLRSADDVLAGRFDLLGYRGLSFGAPVDWHLEPILGRRAPMTHWSRVPFLDGDVVGDHKVIWELNRQQHLVTLARAYRLTGERIYADGVLAYARAWVSANPPGMGINWASSLEVALRAIAWVWAHRLLGAWPERTVEDRRLIEDNLFLHAQHIERNLSTYFSPNTHLTGEALGLLYVGSAMRGPAAARWRRLGTSILFEELERQVRPDGSYFENSTWYHRYTTDFYLHAVLLLRAAGDEVPGEVLETLARMADHLSWLTLPDGTTPLIGDDDGGRLLPLDHRPPTDFRDTLALAAAVLGGGRLKSVAGEAGPSLFWTLGSAGVEAYDRLVPEPRTERSRCFEDAPLVVMRSGWGADASVLTMDGGVASAGSMAHGHASALSLTVTSRGRPCVVDPGTRSYLAPHRDAFRCTPAHSTVVIDGRSIPRPRSMFSWEVRPPVDVDAWVRGVRVDYARFTHRAAPIHRREVFFVDGAHWLVLDRVDGTEMHDCEVRFQLGPAATLEVVSGVAKVHDGDAGLWLAFAGGGAVATSDSPVSNCYGRLSMACAVSCPFGSSHPVLTVIRPFHEEDEPPSVSFAIGDAVAEFWIRGGRRTEYVARRLAPGVLRTELVSADAEVVWLAWDSSPSAVDVFAPATQADVRVGGEMVRLTTTNRHLEGRAAPDGFREAQ